MSQPPPTLNPPYPKVKSFTLYLNLALSSYDLKFMNYTSPTMFPFPLTGVTFLQHLLRRLPPPPSTGVFLIPMILVNLARLANSVHLPFHPSVAESRSNSLSWASCSLRGPSGLPHESKRHIALEIRLLLSYMVLPIDTATSP